MAGGQSEETATAAAVVEPSAVKMMPLQWDGEKGGMVVNAITEGEDEAQVVTASTVPPGDKRMAISSSECIDAHKIPDMGEWIGEIASE